MNRREFNRALGTSVATFLAHEALAQPDLPTQPRRSETPRARRLSAQALRSRLEPYNPVWRSPSLSSLDSMPLCGAQGTGLNVWVQDGDLCFYIGRNDAYDEDGNLLKLGCVRCRLNPNPLLGNAFEQKLDLYTSRISVRAKDNNGNSCEFSIWLDIRQPVIVVEALTPAPSLLEISFLTWRDRKRDYPLDNWNFVHHHNVEPAMRRASPDIVEAQDDALLWYHQNDNANLISERMVQAQRFTAPGDSVTDPSRNAVFGGMLRGRGLQLLKKEPVQWQQWEGNAWTYRSGSSGTRHLATVCIAVQQTQDLGAWKRSLTKTSLASLGLQYRKQARRAAEEWWGQFWSRSYVFVNQDKGPEDIGWQVGKNYQLFRYMLACNRGGTLPLKFNGGIFNVDTHRSEGYRVIDGQQPPPAPPDDRRWSDLFMAQNQRLIGWAGLMSGDFDLVLPSLDFYRDRVATAVDRSRTYWHHGGAAFVEPLSLYGIPVEALATDYGPCSAKHLAWHFSIMIEIAWMALEWAGYSGEDISGYLPMIDAIVRFYDEHYRQTCLQRTGQEYDRDGRLALYPMNCLELYADTTNPIEVVSGLHRVVEAVLALPSQVPTEMRSRFEALRRRLPAICTETRDGKSILKPAENYDPAHPLNRTEFPEMYAVWPYRLYGVGSRKGNALPNDTWELLPANRQPAMGFMSWQCTPIYAALMGRHADAQRLTIEKLSDKNASLRFTAFFGPGHDWIPDHNWGGSAMVGLHSMLLAPADEGLYLLPAWPKEWNVDFRLHVPDGATVLAEVREGQFTKFAMEGMRGHRYRKQVVMPSRATAAG